MYIIVDKVSKRQDDYSLYSFYNSVKRTCSVYHFPLIFTNNNIGSCSIEGKPLCYHANDLGSISGGGHTTRSPYLLALLGQLSLCPSEVGKWVPDNIGANSGSSTMRIAPIDHHWWYDRRLSTYNPGSVGRTMSTKLTEPRFRCYAQLLVNNINLCEKECHFCYCCFWKLCFIDR